MSKPSPITRGAIYRTPAGLVRATIELRGGEWHGRLVTDQGEGEPVTPIPPGSERVEAGR